MNDINYLTVINYYYTWMHHYQNEMKRQKIYYHIYTRDPEELLQEQRKINKILKRARTYDKTKKHFKNH